MTEDVNIKMTVDAGQSIQATNNYKKTLKELKDQMVQLQIETNGLADATAEQRQQYAELEQQAGAITDALGDVSAQIRANADDYQMFNAALEGLKGGAAVAQGLVGTLDMLGISNSGVANVVKTLMSLQGVMNSINAVQQIFNKDSKVRIALQKLLTTSVKQTAAAEGQATVAAGALAAGEGVATTASFTLAGACKAVGVAIKSIPVIGWILAAIAALVSLTQLVVGLLDDGDEGLEQQRQANEQLELQKKHYEEVDSKIIKCKDDFDKWNDILATANKDSQTYKDTLKQLENELGVSLQNSQIDTQTLNKLEAIHLEVKQAQLEAEFEQNQYLADRNKLQQINNVLNAAATLDHKERAAYIQDQLGVDEKMAAQYAAAIHHAADEHRYISDQLTLEGNAASKVYTELNSRIDEHSAKQKKLSDNVIAAVEKQDKFIEEAGLKRINTDNKVTNAHNKNTKNTEDEQEKHLANLVKANKDAAEKINGYWKTYNSDIEKENSKTHEGRLDNLGREYAKTIDTLDKELEDYTKYYNGLTEEDKKALGDQLVTLEAFTDAQNQARAKALEKYTKAVEDENKAEKKRQLDKARESVDRENQVDSEILNARLANLKEGTDLYYETKRELEEEQHEQDMEDLRRRLEDGQLTQEEYDQLAEEAERQHQQNLTNIQAEQDAARLELTQNRLETVGQMLQMASNFTQSLQDAELADEDLSEKEKLRIQKKYAIAGLMVNMAESGVALATSIPKTLEAYSEIPFAGPIIAAIQIAATTASILAQIAKIKQFQQQINTAARGAYVVGPSHSEGGVNYELEGGEAVLNKKAMAIPQYRALASAMNVSTGGVAFPGAGNAAPLQASMDQGTVKSIVKETVAAVTAIPVVVSEESISKTQRKVSVLEGQSRLG